MPKTSAEQSTLMGFAGLAELVSDIDTPPEAGRAEEGPPAEAAPPAPPVVGGQETPAPDLSILVEEISEAELPAGLPVAELLAAASPREKPQAPTPVFAANADRRPSMGPGPHAAQPPKPAPAPPAKRGQAKPAQAAKRWAASGSNSPFVSNGIAFLGLALILFLVGDIIMTRQQKPLSHFLSLLEEIIHPREGGAPAPQAPSPAPRWEGEEKPPAGENLMLNIAQLRYCLAEKLRVGEIENLIDRQAAAEIKAYNNWVTDFNDRCAFFRYDPAAYEAAKRQVEQNQETLKAQAKQRLAAIRAGAAARPPAAQ